MYYGDYFGYANTNHTPLILGGDTKHTVHIREDLLESTCRKVHAIKRFENIVIRGIIKWFNIYLITSSNAMSHESGGFCGLEYVRTSYRTFIDLLSSRHHARGRHPNGGILLSIHSLINS